MRIAVEGCGHGTLHSIYASVRKSCEINAWKNGVDLLIIGGDFQAVRNEADMMCMAVPPKYRELGDFHEYYSGSRVAPYLTIFVGGNHEASNYLRELYYGGWVAPKIYYLGAANVLRVGNLRIAGLSGIWKGPDYNKPHFERLPFGSSEVRSIYHVREYDTRKLLQLRTQVDIGISHDWPKGVEWMGNWRQLFSFKPYFRDDAQSGRLGSFAAKVVLDHLRPRHWFSAHLHAKYAAVIDHTKSGHSDATINHPKDLSASASASTQTETAVCENGGNIDALASRNTDEIDLDIDDIDMTVVNNVTGPPSGDQVQKNGDEIDLDIDDGEPMHVTSNGTDQTNDCSKHNDGKEEEDGNPAQGLSTSMMDEDIRAQLPAAFTRPSAKFNKTSIQQSDSSPVTITNKETRFLALDKCLPGRHFLQLLEVETGSEECAEGPLKLSYDPEWLAITRVFAKEHNPCTDRLPPGKTRSDYLARIETEENWVNENIIKQAKLIIPENFSLTAPIHDPAHTLPRDKFPREYNNPQTVEFCSMLQIPNHFAATEEDIQARMELAPKILEEEARRGDTGRRGHNHSYTRGDGYGSGNRGNSSRGGGRRGGGRGRGSYRGGDGGGGSRRGRW